MLRSLEGVRGKLSVYDPETVSTSNLQRYVLTVDDDEGAIKAALVARALAGTSVSVDPQPIHWEDAAELPPVLCVGLDDAQSRLRVQSALPQSVYNSWTQPADLGWSTHERFGTDPCLACLYWPTKERPGYHELIARSIGQHPLRVLGYLVRHIPVGQPLRLAEVPRVAESPLPKNWEHWTSRSVLEDLVARFPSIEGSAEEWSDKQIGDLYREGVCGGALLSHNEADVVTDMAVPLAHQSVLAGIMLALTLVTSRVPELRAVVPHAVERRIDVLRPFPQVVVRPRARTAGCLCQDEDFQSRYRAKWGSHTGNLS